MFVRTAGVYLGVELGVYKENVDQVKPKTPTSIANAFTEGHQADQGDELSL